MVFFGNKKEFIEWLLWHFRPWWPEVIPGVLAL